MFSPGSLYVIVSVLLSGLAWPGCPLGPWGLLHTVLQCWNLFIYNFGCFLFFFDGNILFTFLKKFLLKYS